MRNGILSQFLDTGWYQEATLFYDNNIYWFEGSTDFSTNESKISVYRWKAKNLDNLHYQSFVKPNGEFVDYTTVFSAKGNDFDLLKKQLLEASIFNGKTFWQVEREVAWLEDGGIIQIDNG